MNKKTRIFAITIVAVIGILSYCHFRSRTPEVVPVPAEEMRETSSVVSTTASPPATAQGAASGFLPTQMEDSEKFAALQKSIKKMNACLATKAALLSENAEFNLAAFAEMIRPFMGDPVMTTNEWATTDIQTSSGEIRRIFLEYKTDIMSDVATSLKYYSISSSGEQKEIPLTAEQMNDPSDTLIASLEADGTVIGSSRSQRAFFQNGANILTVERNGKLYSFDIPFDGKRFRCEGMDAATTIKCQCL